MGWWINGYNCHNWGRGHHLVLCSAPFFTAKCHFSRNGFQLMCSLGYIVPWTLIASIGLSAREVMGDGNDGSLKNIKKHGLSQSSWRSSYWGKVYAYFVSLSVFFLADTECRTVRKMLPHCDSGRASETPEFRALVLTPVKKTSFQAVFPMFVGLLRNLFQHWHRTWPWPWAAIGKCSVKSVTIIQGQPWTVAPS